MILILIGEKDDWSPADRCETLKNLGLVKDSEYECKLKIYPNAYHAFDFEGLIADTYGHHVHGRRNFMLLAEGILPIVCPVRDGTEMAGIGVITRGVEEARKIMDEDPAIKAGVLVYEVHPCRSFPGSALPKE